MTTLQLDGFTYDLSTTPISLDGIEYTASRFTEIEARIWHIQFDRLFAPGNDPVSQIMRAYRGHIFAGGRIAKAALGEPVFAGVEGGTTQMLFQELQAWHLQRMPAVRTATGGPTVETPARSWRISLDTVAGDHNLLGWGTGTIAVPGDLRPNPVNIDKDVAMVLVGISDLTVNRQLRALKFRIGDTEHKPIGTERLQLAPGRDRTPVMAIKTLVLTPRQIVRATAAIDAPISDGKIVLIGLSYGLGSYLTNIYRSTVTL